MSGPLVDYLGRPIRAGGAYEGAVDSRQHPKDGFRRALPYDEDRVVGAYDLEKLRRQCLHLRRNNAIIAGVVRRFADHIVGPAGITPQAKTSSDEWNDLAEDCWRNWCKICDSRQRLQMRGLQVMAVASRLLLGDMGLVLLASGQLQPVEAMRICDPPQRSKPRRCVNGVVTSEGGVPVSFCVHPRTVDSGIVDSERWTMVRAEDMVFVVDPIRIDQLRGVPELASVLNPVTDVGRLLEEVLNKAELDAMHAWAIYSETGAAKVQNAVAARLSSALGGGDETAPAGPIYERFTGGATYYMRPGEKVESLASNTPNSQFDGFVERLLGMIAAAMCVPYDFLLLDFKGGNFSASRAALMTTYRTFEMWQEWLVSTMLQRVWNWRIAKAIQSGDLPPAPVDKYGRSEWWRVLWMTPRYDWIDPKSESASNKIDVEMGVESVGSIAHRKQADIEDVMRAKRADYMAAARECQAANEELERMGLQDRLTLKDFILTPGNGMPIPDPEEVLKKDGDGDGDGILNE